MEVKQGVVELQWRKQRQTRSVSIKVPEEEEAPIRSSTTLRHPHRVSHQHIGHNTEHHALQKHMIETKTDTSIDTKEANLLSFVSLEKQENTLNQITTVFRHFCR